jgi:hypothetical protein
VYKAILFAPDGDWVTDYAGCKTIDEVWDRVDNQGSKWFFYPFYFVITDERGYTLSTQRIVAAPDNLEHLVGKSIKRVSREIAIQTAIASQPEAWDYYI